MQLGTKAFLTFQILRLKQAFFFSIICLRLFFFLSEGREKKNKKESKKKGKNKN